MFGSVTQICDRKHIYEIVYTLSQMLRPDLRNRAAATKLTQLISNILPYLVFKIVVFVICGSLVEQLLRDAQNNEASHC